MSCYNWEKGSFQIPASEWAKVKASIREAVNKENDFIYQGALRLHERLGPKLKGRKHHEWEAIGYKEVEAMNATVGWDGKKFSEDHAFEMLRKVVPGTYNSQTRQENRKFRKPLKKDWPQHGNNVTFFESAGRCSVTFDNASRTMTWRVSENNHAVESARESDLGIAVFSTLRRVNWTRGTGGKIVGNDEYNRDSSHEGGGANYTKEEFGQDAPKLRADPSSFGNHGYGRFR